MTNLEVIEKLKELKWNNAKTIDAKDQNQYLSLAIAALEGNSCGHAPNLDLDCPNCKTKKFVVVGSPGDPLNGKSIEVMDAIRAERERLRKVLESWELTEPSGLELEKLADKYQVPVSVMAVRLFDIQRDEVLKRFNQELV